MRQDDFLVRNYDLFWYNIALCLLKRYKGKLLLLRLPICIGRLHKSLLPLCEGAPFSAIALTACGNLDFNIKSNLLIEILLNSHRLDIWSHKYLDHRVILSVKTAKLNSVLV